MSDEAELPPMQIPENWQISINGSFESQEQVDKIHEYVAAHVKSLSRYIHLVDLDGITIATDYKQALLDLDRGYETSYRLTPSDGDVTGVAMTPTVMRDGKIKSHILINAAYILPITDMDHALYEQIFYLLAHECAHVDSTSAINAAFPGTLLQKKHTQLHEALRQQIIDSCWDEYAASRISARFGKNPVEDYKQTLIKNLNVVRSRADGDIKSYRIHHDVTRVVTDVYRHYGNSLKFGSYLLGAIHGEGKSVDDLADLEAQLEGHWFAPYFMRLDTALQAIATDYGAWNDRDAFDVIGDIADAIVSEGGVHYGTSENPDFVTIPLTPHTMP